MNYETLLLAIENNICIITINRPDKLNALNSTVIEELSDAIDKVIRIHEIKSAIITGAGHKSFVAGADISQFIGLSKDECAALAA